MLVRGPKNDNQGWLGHGGLLRGRTTVLYLGPGTESVNELNMKKVSEGK